MSTAGLDGQAAACVEVCLSREVHLATPTSLEATEKISGPCPKAKLESRSFSLSDLGFLLSSQVAFGEGLLPSFLSTQESAAWVYRLSATLLFLPLSLSFLLLTIFSLPSTSSCFSFSPFSQPPLSPLLHPSHPSPPPHASLPSLESKGGWGEQWAS